MRENCSLAIVDNTDPDNLACVLALANAKVKHTLLGVIVTGRAANFDRRAAPDEVDLFHSEYVCKLNAARMKKFLRAAGRGDVPVFVGSRPPYTIVPHNVHIDEREFRDLTEYELDTVIDSMDSDINLLYRLFMLKERFGISALGEAYELLGFLDSPVDLIVGGPMTDVAWIMRSYGSKIRSVHAQFGTFGFGAKGLMEFGDRPRGKRQFNVACDPEAAHDVLMNLKAPIYLYPSDVTRVDALGFQNPEELATYLEDTTAVRELLRIYSVAYEKMVKSRGEKIYIHDLAPAFGYLDMYLFAQDEIEDRGARAQDNIYTMKPVEILDVPHLPEERDSWGEIRVDFNRTDFSGFLPRYVATDVSAERYLQEMRKLVR